MITVQRMEAPPFDLRSALRYGGVHTEELCWQEMAEACYAELAPHLTYRVCYGEFGLTREGKSLDLGFAAVDSASLAKSLTGCDRVLLFAATVGLEPDRRIARYAVTSPTKALWMQAVGSERVESLCDAFCAERAKAYGEEGRQLRPRFSPGYGDLPLALQREIFGVLNCSARIGVSLNESLLMSPSKSVTALMGILPPKA